jgi:hypothetical protein
MMNSLVGAVRRELKVSSLVLAAEKGAEAP